MNKRFIYLALLLLAVTDARLLAQDGDAIEEGGGSTGGGNGGGNGGSSSSGSGSSGRVRDDGNWWWTEDEDKENCDPDTSPPWLIFNMLPYDDEADCPDDVPEAPTATAWDYCDGGVGVNSSEVTNYNAAGLPVSVLRIWSATDAAGKSSTWRQVIFILDTEYPVIDIKTEVEVETEANGRAKMPDYSSHATDDFGYLRVTQTPGPGGEYSTGDRQPVSLVAEDGCGRKTTNIFTVIFSCGGCPGSCSAGSGSPNNACVSLNLSLGRLANGRSAGHLSLFAQQPSSRLFSPEALRYVKEGAGAVVIRDTNGWLRQIRSADVLVDIVTNNGYQFSYDIRFYSPSSWGSPDESGLFVPSGRELLSWRIYAPQVLPHAGGPIANSNRVSLLKMQGAARIRYEYQYDKSQHGWNLTSGIRFRQPSAGGGYFWDRGLMVESRFSSTSGTVRTETYVVSSPAGSVAFREVKEYRQFSWGEAWTKSVQGEGDTALTTERGYYENPLLPGRYVRLAWERQPDGNFTWYDYDGQGRVVMEARPWKDVAVPVLESNALMVAAAVTLYDYEPVAAADDGSVRPWKPRMVTELAGGVVVSKTVVSYVAGANGEIEELKEECAAPGDPFGAAGNRRTRTTFYSDAEELWPGAVKSVEYPDGRLDRFVMERGNYVDGGDEPGAFIVGSGDFVRSTVIHGTVLHPEGTGKTTREVSVRRVLGEEILRETYVFGGTGYHRVDWTIRRFDEQGHLLSENFANGLARSSQWSICCGKESDVDVDGARTFYEYDALGRIEIRTKTGVPKISSATAPGYPEQPDIVATYVYDGAGNVLGEMRNAMLIRTNQTPEGVVTQEIMRAEVSSHGRYDLAGRQVESWDTSGLLTRYEYAEGGRIATVVRPGGAAEITENYPDGRVKSVTGTGVVPRFYDYGVDPDGSQWTMVYTGRPDSPMWVKTTTDMLGRMVKDEKPGFGGTLLTTAYDYNDKSQLVAVRQWSGNPPAAQIGPATLYEYNELGEQARTVQDVNGNGVVDLEGPDRVTETQSRIVTLSGERWRETISKVYPVAGSANSVASSVQRRPMAGEGSGYSALKSESVDVRGNTTVTTVAVDPTRRIVTTSLNSPDSTVDAVTVVRNGLVHSTRPSIWRDPTYFANDGLGRQVMVTDPRTGEHYTTYNKCNQIEETQDGAGNSTRYQYDSETGLRISVSDAIGEMVFTAYDLQGRPTNVWGATYPVAYEYDASGRMSVLKTWSDTNAEPNVTRWFYDEATGLLTNKVYADGNGTSYEYDAAGRLTRRIWARGVATDYAYDALGQLTNIDYSDDTPDVSFTYDRVGRQVAITDVLGTRTNVYDPATFDLAAEQLPDGLVLARSHDRFGRPAGIALDEGYQVDYAYDDASRFMAITSAVNAVTTAVKYAYLAQSDLVSGWTAKDPAGRTMLEAKRLYEARRDLVATAWVSNANGVLSQYDYRNDGLGRRVARRDRVDGMVVSNAFGYNGRSELDVAIMGTNRFGYQYDAIGNRQAAVANDQSVQYEANALNQYTSILPADETLAYDADGNMTSDGTHSYIWDAENRLVEIRPAATNADSQMVQCLYDYQGRRVGKRVFAWGTFGGNDDWYWADGRYFVYDGWNLIGEYKPPARPTTLVPYASATNMFLLGVGGAIYASYVWGLDLSGSLQGTGGVGGVLVRSVPDSNAFDYAFCDANGNVMGLVSTNGAVDARYDYDPYGNLMAMSGDQAEANPFRFSSKYWEEEPGFYYYGYRFYCPAFGRWLSRDPIEEGGGMNIYEFVNNAPLSRFDMLGLWGPNVHHIATRDWAQGLGYPSDAAEAIGLADEAVDHGSTSFLPIRGDQRYHFDRNQGVGIDSRMQRYQMHLEAAQAACTATIDDPTMAAAQLGTALHPYQDWVAHGEYGIYDDGNIWETHNWRSPQDETWGEVTSYPDNVRLDAVNGPDGRPAGMGMHVILANMGLSVREFAVYQPGTRRISLTRDMTTGTLKEFRDYVRNNAVPACKCRKYFGVE